MIIDQFAHLMRYQIPQVTKILKFISENNLMALPQGQIDIDGKKLFVRVMEYVPKPAHENRFEIHRVYADLQYVLSGVELMQIAPKNVLQSLDDDKGDYEFYKASETITDLVVSAGDFTFFYPTEAHRPGCLYKGHTELIKKLVFKIKI